MTEDSVMIRSGKSEFRLSAEDPAEFPPVASFTDDCYYMLPAQSFKQLIHRTIFATDVESTRYALGGVLVELSSDNVTLAATDTRRLAVVTSTCRSHGVEGVEKSSPVIPSKAMALIEKSIADDDEDVWIAVHDNDVLVKTGTSTIYSRLVEGRFPNYADVVPKESNHTIELVVGPFYAAIRQAQIVTNEESRGVDFVFSDGQLTMNSIAAEIGQSTIELPISFTGDTLRISFDPRYISDFLRILDSGATIHLKLIDEEKAAVLQTDDSYTYVIMPLSKER